MACLSACFAAAALEGCGGDGSKPLSDLRATVCAGPLEAAAGATITVTSAVANEGSLASGASRLGVYLSDDAEITIDDVLLCERDVDELEPGSDSRAATVAAVPAGIAPGSYRLGVIADSGAVEAESDETNNFLAASSAITVTAPSDVNLRVTDVSGPAAADRDETITVTTTVTNVGSAASGSFVVRIFLSVDGEATEGDIFLGHRVVASLAPGASDTAATSVTIGRRTRWGGYFIGAVADATGAVIESDETDNAATSAAEIVIGSPPAPDAYEVDDVPADAKEVVVDGPVQDRSFHREGDVDWVYLTVSSRCGISVRADLAAVGLYEQDGQTRLGWGWTRLSHVLDGPGTYLLRLTGGGARTYTLEVTSFSVGYQVDLTPGDTHDMMHVLYRTSRGWDFDGWAPLGEPVILTVAPWNRGTGEAGPFHVDFYLSREWVFSPWEPLGQYLGRDEVDYIGPGGVAQVMMTTVIPHGTPPGDYYVTAVVDPDWRVLETDETNNIGSMWHEITVGSDVAANWVRAPASAAAGDTVSFDYHVSLVPGSEHAKARFYLSADRTLDPSDREVAADPIDASGPGRSSGVVLAPGDPPAGTYYVIMAVELDPSWGVRREADCGNNRVSSPTPIVVAGAPAADLVADAVAGDLPVCDPGDTLAVTDAVTNSGSVAAGACAVGFELCLVGDDVVVDLGERALPPLAQAATDGATTAFTVPAGTAGGLYELAAVADAHGAVTERSEWNNVAVDLVGVRGADAWEPGNDGAVWDTTDFYPERAAEGPSMTIHQPGDVDWVDFRTDTPGVTLRLETVDLRDGMDTVMEVWCRGSDVFGDVFMEDIDDDSGAEPGASAVTRTFAQAGYYLLRIYHMRPAGTGIYGIRATVLE
jgi:subtilase family serine protease